MLVSQRKSNRGKSRDFHTYLGLSLAANNLPIFTKQYKTKVATQASAKVVKEYKQKKIHDWSIQSLWESQVDGQRSDSIWETDLI